MKHTKLLTTAALALASAALIQSSASAQVSAQTGDLVLGFDEVGGTNPGSTQDYEVDLGAFTNYAAAGYTISFNLNTDLTTAYGSGYGDRTDVEYAIVGTNGTATGAKTLYVATPGADGAPTTSTNQSPGAADIQAYTLALNNATSASLKQGTLQFTNSTTNGFTQAYNNANGNIFGQSTLGDTPLAQYISTTGADQTTTAELYALPQSISNAVPAIPVDEGTFSFDSADGILTFTSATALSTPEPSAYALGICALVLFAVLKRRHSVA
jgi:hypothetical protein